MIKKVKASQLRLGMYVHDLGTSWLSHPFAKSRFLISGAEDIEKIVQADFSEITIDIAKGVDIADCDAEPSGEQAGSGVQIESPDLPSVKILNTPAPVSFAEELDRAASVRDEALRFVETMMEDARYGRLPELERAEPVVHNIVGSIIRNPSALPAILQVKDIDNYTFLHSVSVCALMAAFCRSLGFPPDVTFQASLGGLLHDIGKATVPLEILNKPGRLSTQEYETIKRHPEHGHAMLSHIAGIGVIPLNIVLGHHERLDGSGYPGAFQEGAISELAQMAAVVDVYDAISSNRCYHQGMLPATSLGKLHEWSGTQYSRRYVEAFIRCIGIYPSGSLVLLASGRLGVVAQQNSADLRAPVVHAFFSTNSQSYIPPCRVRLKSHTSPLQGDTIVSVEDPKKWKVKPETFLAIE